MRAGATPPPMPMHSPLRAVVALLGAAGLLGACAAPPTLMKMRPPVVLEQPRPPPKRPVAARPAPSHGECEAADATGLTEAQKAALFDQFDAWHSQAAKSTASATNTQADHRLVAVQACRPPTP